MSLMPWDKLNTAVIITTSEVTRMRNIQMIFLLMKFSGRFIVHPVAVVI